jgi:hypothetical protein
LKIFPGVIPPDPLKRGGEGRGEGREGREGKGEEVGEGDAYSFLGGMDALAADRGKVKFGELVEDPCPKKVHLESDRNSQTAST